MERPDRIAVHPLQKSLDRPKTDKSAHIKSQFMHLILLHPIVDGDPRSEFVVKVKEVGN